jgi:protein TonB
MPRTFTLVSVVVHAVVIGGVLSLQALDVGPLPLPRDAMAFTERLVKIVDIALPAPPRRAAAAAEAAAPPDAAPIAAPERIAPETGLAREAAPAAATGEIPGGTGGGLAVIAIPGATLVPPATPPPPAPQQPVRLHVGIEPPRKIVNVDPLYPPLARAARQEGVVILETVIDVQGAVETVRVLRGFSLLNQAAVEAVQQWRFTPARLNGQPVPVVMTVTVNFSLR